MEELNVVGRCGLVLLIEGKVVCDNRTQEVDIMVNNIHHHM